MMDLFDLPPQFTPGDTVQIFRLPATVTNLQWSTWRKPKGASMLYILCVGGGGGGGGGHVAAAGNPRGGGGGGGSAALTRLLIPAHLVPDTLFVQVGVGGQGSAPSLLGEPGVLSYVAVSPNTHGSNTLAVSGGGTASGGGGGTAVSGGSAGSGGAAAGNTNHMLAYMGLFNVTAGTGGAGGGAPAGAIGSPIGIPTSTGLQGGSGGAGTTSADFAGGAFSGIAGSWLSEQRPATPAPGTNAGSGGPQIWTPFFGFGGGGGSSSNAGNGGVGGNGAHGAGGGGGGAGTSGGSRGGNGGDGIVVITSW